MIVIRNETEKDFRIVEELAKKAFWNVNRPGCDEHYLTHIMREHSDFIPQLDFVIEENEQIIGNIMYVKSKLIASDGETKEILMFGPISILPEFQRKGYGKKLINYSFEKALELGYDTVVIYGNPENYVSCGFKNCKKFNVGLDKGVYPVSLLVKELKEGVLAGKEWRFVESPVFRFDEKEAEKFDEGFEPMKKEYRTSQELFYIYSGSFMNK